MSHLMHSQLAVLMSRMMSPMMNPMCILQGVAASCTVPQRVPPCITRETSRLCQCLWRSGATPCVHFAASAMAERCASNSLVQLIMSDQWLDQSCDDLPDSFRNSEVVSMQMCRVTPTVCFLALTCLSHDPLGIAILELVSAQN